MINEAVVEVNGDVDERGRYTYWDINALNTPRGTRLLYGGRPFRPKSVEAWVEICNWSVEAGVGAYTPERAYELGL